MNPVLHLVLDSAPSYFVVQLACLGRELEPVRVETRT